jgi:hypothetical protein
MITLNISFFSVSVELIVCARASGTSFIAVVITPSNVIDTSAKARPSVLLTNIYPLVYQQKFGYYLSSEDVIQKITTLQIYERGLNLAIAENLLVKMVRSIKNPVVYNKVILTCTRYYLATNKQSCTL